MMFAISLLLSYVFTGLTRAANGLTADPSQKPAWALNRPGLGTVAWVVATWPAGRVQDARNSATDNPRRDVAFAVMNAGIEFMLLAVLTWGALELASSISDYLILNVLLSIIFLFVVLRFLLPIITVLMAPLMALLGLGLDLILPARRQPPR
jgi:hypothetical protein